MGTVTNAVRFGGHRYFASQRPGQRSPPRYPPLSLPNAHSTPGRKALGSGPRGALLSSLWGKAEEAARFRCRSRGVAGNPGSTDSGAQSRLRAAASPLPQSALGRATPPPHPPCPRALRDRGRASAGPAATPGGPAEPSEEAGGARPDPGRPQPGPPSPRALTSARDADSGRTSGRRATARAAGAGAGADRRGGAGPALRRGLPLAARVAPPLPRPPGAEATSGRPQRALGSFIPDWCVCSFACHQAVSEPLIWARHWAKRCDGPPR